MALKPCKECGKYISSEATACPNCGKSYSTGRKTSPLAMGCLVLIVIGVLGSMFAPSASTVPRKPSAVPIEPMRKIVIPPRKGPSSGNPAHDQLSSLSVSDRNFALASMMETTGGGCPSVRRSFYQGMDKQRNALWSFECQDGTDYQLLVKPDADGSTKVLACRVLKAVAGAECWKKF